MYETIHQSPLSANPSQNFPKMTDSSFPNSSEIIGQTQVFTSQFENLEHVREFVGKFARENGLSPSEVYAAQLAVDEAFSNIIEHSYGGECLEKIECTCQVLDSGVAISLRDCGKPFDPTAVPDPDLEAELEDRDIGGLGLFFIRQLMDEIEFTFTWEDETGKQCNVLRMVKHKES
jgi:serine/threonine-protein kinase RsbW